ncbi:unannotated protein [freshwater metagenome]|uniref:Unannotated protein n=1 Tax=freshwater metagenome TaxID=449393 RepID=A0A6J6JY61_9ZZZZ
MTAKGLAHLDALVSKLSCAAGAPALRNSAINETTVNEAKKATNKPSFPLRPVVKRSTTESAIAIKILSTFCERSRAVGSHGLPGFGVTVAGLIVDDI